MSYNRKYRFILKSKRITWAFIWSNLQSANKIMLKNQCYPPIGISITPKALHQPPISLKYAILNPPLQTFQAKQFSYNQTKWLPKNNLSQAKLTNLKNPKTTIASSINSLLNAQLTEG